MNLLKANRQAGYESLEKRLNGYISSMIDNEFIPELLVGPNTSATTLTRAFFELNTFTFTLRLDPC